MARRHQRASASVRTTTGAAAPRSTTRRSASLARGMTIRTMNKMMKGSPAESPPNHEMVAAYLVARASTDADEQAADEHEGEIGEVADGRRAEGRDDQQGDGIGIEVQRRGDQQAGHGGEDGADDPGPAAHDQRVGARHRDQLGIVDHASHGHPQAHEAEEVVQDGRGQRRR